MIRIDLVGQLCAGEICASARPAASVAAQPNAAHQVRILRILAPPRLLPPPCGPCGEGRGGGSCRGAQECQLARPPPPTSPHKREGGSSLPQTLEPSAVEIERDAGDVARPLRAEEHDGVGKLRRGAEAAKRIFPRRNPP